MAEAKDKLVACPDCERRVPVRVIGPDDHGPVRLLLGKHKKDGRECAGSEQVYVEGEKAVNEALRTAVTGS